ncbi:MAG: UvrD-helicase domain-containing protein, partial [Deltaproteobacteria bacterium]|nr:UvrD-helicase domain-containing protein [Deltaproteobacteria bacterium]
MTSKFFADLHIHSRFSRATSKALTLENINLWAGYKGLNLVGTGDMTHPQWLKEIEENLVPGDDGFYGLKDGAGVGGARFVLTGEVSAIYKHSGRTRKIHLLVVAPNLEAAINFSQALGRLGNIKSDGRPILGLKARDILEVALNCHPEMQVIPAHVWTPWFSLFGSKSGYDALEECFEDLSSHIKALETGLSSDPFMNRLVSSLDKYALVSSSDAHSPEKLGREATVIEGELTFNSLKEALAGGPALGGTVEFFPEEGKYHLDGHASCGPAITPEKTSELGGLCPVCGKPVTVGVLSRVLELSDRKEPPSQILKPDWHILPLSELLTQVLDRGPASKEISQAYAKLVGEFGSEFNLLLSVPLSDIEAFAGKVMARAVEKTRLGEVETSGGYDGVFGKITVLSREERLSLEGQNLLFTSQFKPRGRSNREKPTPPSQAPKIEPPLTKRRAAAGGILSSLSQDQLWAVTYNGASLAILAGPGSGKTSVLVRRAAFLISKGVSLSDRTLLTTYTRKAAEALRQRLKEILGEEADKVKIETLHALAFNYSNLVKNGFRLADSKVLEALAAEDAAKLGLTTKNFLSRICLIKNRLEYLTLIEGPFKRAYDSYQFKKEALKIIDFDDLIIDALNSQESFPYIAVLADEFQDFSLAQFRFLLKLASNASLSVIGDPDQSIYGFRGARANIFEELAKERGDLIERELKINYRSSPYVISAAEAVRLSGGPPRKAF